MRFNEVRTFVDITAPPQGRVRIRRPWAGQPSARFLWPAFARQMLLRERRLMSLNLLQEYGLRLWRAGLRDVDLGELLLPPGAENGSNRRNDNGDRSRLVARVLEELRRNEAIDTAGEVTKLGLDMLDTVEREAEEVTSRYVLQDPWSGAVWNRFPTSLLNFLIEVSRTREGGLDFALRADDYRRTNRIYLFDPGDVPPCPIPDPEAIKKAFDVYAQDWRAVVIGRGEDDDAAPYGEDSAEEPRGVSEIIEIGKAEPVYLQAVAFLPDDGVGGGLWRAADPFGLGIDPDFRLRIDEIGRTVKPAGERFLSWIARQLAARTKAEAVDGKATVSAAALVDAGVGAGVAGYSHLYEELIAMQRAALEVERLKDEDDRKRDAGSQARLAILGAQICLEHVFRMIAGRFETKRVYATFDLVPGEREDTAAELRRVAAELGFTGSSEEEGKLPDRLVHVEAGRIRPAADALRGSINALLWSSVLAAYVQRSAAIAGERHPVLYAAESYPEMLVDISWIAGMRDEVGHAVSDPVKYVPQVGRVVEKVYRILRVLWYREPPSKLPAEPNSRGSAASP
jgi:hypothetical protein